MPEYPELDADALFTKKETLLSEFEDLSKVMGLKDRMNALKVDVQVLNETEVSNGVKMAKANGIIAKCKEWIEERASIISNRVNGNLKGCSIQMWSTQKNGEDIPDCVILDKKGVKYGKTNNATRIKINIEMQKLFMEHAGTQLPIFIDEASIFSSNNIPVMEEQHVLIFASDDNKLIVE